MGSLLIIGCIDHSTPPVVVNKDGRDGEFKALDAEGMLKNVSFLLSDGTPYLCASYGTSSKVFTPIARTTRSRITT